jgi:hypothetical protein
VSPRTKVCNWPSIRGKPNKKATNKKKLISRESPSIVRVIKTYSQTTKKNANVENGNDTRHYKTNIR